MAKENENTKTSAIEDPLDVVKEKWEKANNLSKREGKGSLTEIQDILREVDKLLEKLNEEEIKELTEKYDEFYLQNKHLALDIEEMEEKPVIYEAVCVYSNSDNINFESDTWIKINRIFR